MSLSDRAHERTRRALPEGPQDAVVHADVAESTEPVRVRLGQGRDRYVETAVWASSGRLPAQGDNASVWRTPLGSWALVDATGPLVTS